MDALCLLCMLNTVMDSIPSYVINNEATTLMSVHYSFGLLIVIIFRYKKATKIVANPPTDMLFPVVF